MHGPSNMAELTDEQLFINYVDLNDQDAFAALHKRHSRRVQEWLRKEFTFQYKGQEADIMQQAFLKVHLEAPKFDRKNGVFRPWLFEIAKNETINEGIKQKAAKRGGKVTTTNLTRPDEEGGTGFMDPRARPRGMTSYETLPDGDVVPHDMTHEELHELVDQLEPQDREIIHALAFDGLTEQEAANKIGMTRYRIRLRYDEILTLLKQKANAA